MRSLLAWIDNEISLLSKQDFQGCGGVDLKNNASVGEAFDQMGCAEQSSTVGGQTIKELLSLERNVLYTG